MTFLEKVFRLIDAIPDISTIPVSPSVFSDDTEKYDCDECEDKFDCKSCWKEAVTDADRLERIEQLKEAQDVYAVDAYHWVHRIKFIDRVNDFIGYLEIDDLEVTPSIFSGSIDCKTCENRWKLDDSHDPDVCANCWEDAVREAYKKEE